MDFEPLRRLISDRAEFARTARLGRDLVPLAYLLSLVVIVIWAINHLAWRFFQGWGQAAWGIVEVLCIGVFLLLLARIGAEALLQLFKERIDREAELPLRPRMTPSMLDEVHEAIQDLGEDEHPVVEEKAAPTPPPRPRRSTAKPIAPEAKPEPDEPPRSPPVRRTAKRSPPPTDQP
jgi:hypothetical protein